MCYLNHNLSPKHPEMLHKNRLEHLIKNLHLIREDSGKIKYMLIEGIWKPAYEGPFIQMPDIIAIRHDNSALIAELKHSEGAKSKAIAQLYHGSEFVKKEWGIKTFNLKFVVYYNDGGYTFEKIIPPNIPLKT